MQEKRSVMKHKRGGFLGLAASLDHPQRAVGGNVTFILRVPIKWMDEENKRMGDFLSAEAGREFPCPSAKALTLRLFLPRILCGRFARAEACAERERLLPATSSLPLSPFLLLPARLPELRGRHAHLIFEHCSKICCRLKAAGLGNVLDGTGCGTQ